MGLPAVEGWRRTAPWRAPQPSDGRGLPIAMRHDDSMVPSNRSGAKQLGRRRLGAAVAAHAAAHLHFATVNEVAVEEPVAIAVHHIVEDCEVGLHSVEGFPYPLLQVGNISHWLGVNDVFDVPPEAAKTN